MQENLSPIEYEGLEYILLRLVREWESQNGIPIECGMEIREIIERTSTGIRFLLDPELFWINKRYTIQGLHLQQSTCILTAYDTLEYEYPIYIDMTDFMDTTDFDLDYLIYKLEQHR